VTRILFLITDDGKVITVDIDYSPPPGEVLSAAERLARKIEEFLRTEFDAETSE